jgi:glycosyltransferase involved in cell wall biosynthesis
VPQRGTHLRPPERMPRQREPRQGRSDFAGSRIARSCASSGDRCIVIAQARQTRKSAFCESCASPHYVVRITYIHQYFNTPNMKGGTRSYEMARRMVAAGHQVHMITSRIDGAISGSTWVQEKIDGIDVHWLPVEYDNAMGYARRLLAFSKFARKASTYAAAIKADIVFATSTPLTVALPGIVASRRQRVPMVFEVRDLWPELPIAMGALSFPFAQAGARWLERWAYRNSDRIVVLSPGMGEGVARTGYPKDRIHCIPNSSDIDLFDVPKQRGHAFRAKRPWLGDRPLVIYAGTFGRINGVGYLAELAASMKDIAPAVRFLAVGAGAESNAIRERAIQLNVLDQNFFIEDAMKKSDIPDLFSAADVSTSLFVDLKPMWNNSANKFFDSLAAGRPIAINYGGWQADLLNEAGAGIVIDPANPALAAQRLRDFLDDRAALERAGRLAAALARSRFSRDGLAAELIEVLTESMVRGSRNRSAPRNQDDLEGR